MIVALGEATPTGKKQLAIGNSTVRACWCGNTALEPFAPAYAKCLRCQTLVSQVKTNSNPEAVGTDEEGLYGRDYWFGHQAGFGHPNIVERSRSDLTERCIHWLRTTLKYRLPAVSLLELGCAHGGFVGLAKAAGYQATGLDLSPWMVDYARHAFGVLTLVGPVQNQTMLLPGSLDIIAMMDVVEHLPDPVGTLKHCLSLLEPDGLFILQTPALPENQTLAQLDASQHKFPRHLKPAEHLYLFSKQSMRELFVQIGCPHVYFEKAMFDFYDQFCVASRVPLTPNSPEVVADHLMGLGLSGRMVLAMLDLQERNVALAAEKKYAQLKLRALEAGSQPVIPD